MSEIFAQLGIDWRLLLAQVVNFAILLYVLKRFAYQPVLSALDARRKRVEEAERLAEENEQEAQRSEQEREKMLSEARKRSSEIIAEAEQDAEDRKANIIVEAEHERQRIVADGRKELKDERAQIKGELKHELGDLITAAVRKTLSDFADEQSTKRLTKEALDIVNEEYSQY